MALQDCEKTSLCQSVSACCAVFFFNVILVCLFAALLRPSPSAVSVCELVSPSVCQSAITLSRLFWLSRVGWGQGSEKLIPHNPSLPGQVAALVRRTYTLT